MSTTHQETEMDQVLWDYHQTEFRENFVLAHPRFDYLARLIKKEVPSEGTVLDIGFGDGYLLERLSESGFIARGVDLAVKNIEYTENLFQEKNLDIELKVGNINQLPYINESFDAIVASEVLEHLSSADLHRAVQEIHRCLRPAGVFIGTVPADEDLTGNKCFCPQCGNVFHRWGHKQSYSRSRLHDEFSGVFPQVVVSKLVGFLSESTSAYERIRLAMKCAINRVKRDNGFSGKYCIVARK